MDLIKIGNFIAERRKLKGLTQMQLAERLHVTDRAISKWECGRSMPDSSIMLELCAILEISVNELLTGEELEMKDYSKQAELNLLEMTKQKEESDKRLLFTEVVIGILGVVVFLIMLAAGIYVVYSNEQLAWLTITLIVVGFVQFLAICFVALRIEQKAGYYECTECGHRYVPSFNQVLWARHIGRKRKMVCPRCGKKVWHKKVISENK